MRLKELKIGETARLLGFEPSIVTAYRQRLLALGLIPGVELTLIRVAPLGDPVEINVRGFSLCLRQQEATKLDLERIDL